MWQQSLIRERGQTRMNIHRMHLTNSFTVVLATSPEDGWVVDWLVLFRIYPLYVRVCMCSRVYVCASCKPQVWRDEDKFVELTLPSSCYMAFKDWTGYQACGQSLLLTRLSCWSLYCYTFEKEYYSEIPLEKQCFMVKKYWPTKWKWEKSHLFPQSICSEIRE